MKMRMHFRPLWDGDSIRGEVEGKDQDFPRKSPESLTLSLF